MIRKILPVLILAVSASGLAFSQGSSFLNDLSVGFGAGVNFAHIIEGL